MERDVKGGRGGEGRKFPSVLLLAPFSAAVFDSRPSLFSPNSTGNACHAGYRERSGKNDVILFFLLFTLLLGTRLSPAFARLKTQKKKEETNKGESHPKNVGTELELSLNPSVVRFVSPLIFSISHTHPPTHHQKKTLRVIVIMRPFYLFYTLTKSIKQVL